MTGGFGAVPDELFRTANAISDAVGTAAGMVWQGPSGDYGHPGVHAGWGWFIEDMKAEIAQLREKADGHGESLKLAAAEYVDSDSEASHLIAKVDQRLHDVPGGGFTGGTSKISQILGGGAQVGGGVSGVMSPERSRELFPRTSGSDESTGLAHDAQDQGKEIEY
jgi:hypothetical protein